MIEKVTLAMLLRDWLDEHYPGVFMVGKLDHKYSSWDTDDSLELQDPPHYIDAQGKVIMSKLLGRIGLDAFDPWIYGTREESYPLCAADPEFFTKLDFFLKHSIKWCEERRIAWANENRS